MATEKRNLVNWLMDKVLKGKNNTGKALAGAKVAEAIVLAFVA